MKRYLVIFTATGHNHGEFDTMPDAQAYIDGINEQFPGLSFHVYDITKAFA